MVTEDSSIRFSQAVFSCIPTCPSARHCGPCILTPSSCAHFWGGAAGDRYISRSHFYPRLASIELNYSRKWLENKHHTKYKLNVSPCQLPLRAPQSLQSLQSHFTQGAVLMEWKSSGKQQWSSLCQKSFTSVSIMKSDHLNPLLWALSRAQKKPCKWDALKFGFMNCQFHSG